MEGKSILIFGENHDEYYTENDYEKLHEFIELNKGVENIISIREDLSLNDVIQNFDTPNISFMVNHYQEDGMDYINSREICPYKNIFEIDYRNLGRIHEIISDSLQRYKLGYSINDINEKLKDIWGRYYDLLGIVFYDDVNLKEQVILYFDYLQETYNIYSDGIERENEINWLDEKNETLMILLNYKNFLYQNYNSDVIQSVFFWYINNKDIYVNNLNFDTTTTDEEIHEFFEDQYFNEEFKVDFNKSFSILIDLTMLLTISMYIYDQNTLIESIVIAIGREHAKVLFDFLNDYGFSNLINRRSQL